MARGRAPLRPRRASSSRSRLPLTNADDAISDPGTAIIGSKLRSGARRQRSRPLAEFGLLGLAEACASRRYQVPSCGRVIAGLMTLPRLTAEQRSAPAMLETEAMNR